MEIFLPPGAFTILQRIEEYKSASSLILDATAQEELSVKHSEGTIVHASPEVEKYKGYKIFFRPGFGEPITIGEQDLIYFRDFNSSIYYAIKD